MSTNLAPAGRPEVQAALVLLSGLGLTPEDLMTHLTAHRPAVPTFAEFVPQVIAATSAGSLKCYQTYWKRIVEQWGSRRLDEPTPLEIEQFGKQVRANRIIRRNGRTGASTEEHFIAAMRCLYNRAAANGHIREADNPAAKVAKPRRPASMRRALPDERLAELHQVASATGDDPELDSLLLRFHTETACRRGGALNVRRLDLDQVQCLVRLREKGDTERWQPVSPTLMRHLLAHWDGRGVSDPAAQLFRYRSKRPITYRRYDGLWVRLGRHLPWVAAQGISAHWLRHTVLKWVERTFGYAVARAFAGHSERGNSELGSTAVYVKADLNEVAEALAALTGEPHPLAL